MKFESVLSKIPNYTGFLTMDELDNSTKILAEKYPETVEMFIAGYSRQNKPIYCLKIGNGSKNALAFGCPHPNEPIGSMTLEFLSEELATNKELREEMDYTWYIIKAIDYDAAKLNEGWFKGPFNVYNYLRNYYRPASKDQVEWTFPVKYKDYEYNSPIKETKILMDLIDEIKPRFIYSLHNLGFGGAYWYISKDYKELYDVYYKSVERMGIPRKLGEPEVPYSKVFSPAVFQMFGTKQRYDYLEKFSDKKPAEVITSGTSSDDYANNVTGGNTVTFVCELPYFFEKRVNDLSNSNITRREAVIRSCEYELEHHDKIFELANPIVGYLTDSNPFKNSLLERLSQSDSVKSKIEWAKKSDEFNQLATVSQECDNLIISRFFKVTTTTILIRSCEYELNSSNNISNEIKENLKFAKDKAEAMLKAECQYLEDNLDYKVTPIRNLVTVQVECGLNTAKAVGQE